MKIAVLFALAATAMAADNPRIVYSKYFKGSTPESVFITLDHTGAGTYRDAPDDDNPLKFQATPAQTAEIFALVDKLDHFKHPLESNLKVAQMGIKTFRYENGAEVHETKFNYSLDPDARALADWFERVIETEEDYIALDRDIHFDKLGVDQSLLNVEVTFDHNRLIDPPQFFPLFDRIIKNESYLHMDRERAARLKDEFRKPRETAAQ